MKHLVKSVLAVSAISLLVGCANTTTTTTTDKTADTTGVTVMPSFFTGVGGLMRGTFLDNFVVGLDYTCSLSGYNGQTSASGRFDYETGDTVTFSIGSYPLGSALADEFTTPYNLFPANRTCAINVAQLLQTLDIDDNPENGIILDPALVANIDNLIPICDLDFDTKMEVALGEPLVSEEDARTHLNQTLEDNGVEYTNDYSASYVETHEFGGSSYTIKDMEFSPDGSKLYAPLTGEDELGVLDVNTGDVRFIDTDGNYVRNIKISSDGSTAYLSDPDEDYFIFINLVNETFINSIELNTDTPIALDITSDGTKAYAVGHYGIWSVPLGDPENVEDNDATQLSNLDDNYYNSAVLSSDETKVYMCNDSSEFTIYNITTNTYEIIDISNKCNNLVLNSDETRAYTASKSAGIDVIDLTTSTLIDTIIDISDSETFNDVADLKITSDDDALFVADVDSYYTLYIVDLNDNNSVTQVTEDNENCPEPRSLEISPDETKIFMGCYNTYVAEFDIIKN